MEQTLPHQNSELTVFFGNRPPIVQLKKSWMQSGWVTTLPFLPNYLLVCMMTLILSPVVLAVCFFRELSSEDWLGWDEDGPLSEFDWD